MHATIISLLIIFHRSLPHYTVPVCEIAQEELNSAVIIANGNMAQVHNLIHRHFSVTFIFQLRKMTLNGMMVAVKVYVSTFVKVFQREVETMARVQSEYVFPK